MKTELLQSPASGQSVELTSAGDLLDGQQKVGQYFPEEQRIEWIAFNDYPGLNNRILKEIQKYDAWAADEACKLPTVSVENLPFSIDEEIAYRRSVNLQSLGLSMEKLVRSKRVLDIGGSCRDSWRFLRAGADTIHQVEVSSPSQRLGLRRIANMLPDSDQKLIDRVVFHTSPAEFLPFADQSFDFVFSRSTIHHTDRSKTIPEIHRVLRPGGQVLFIEPLRSRMVYRIVHFVRWIARRDRGTDDPLTSKDIRLLRACFSQVRFRPKNPLEYDLKDTCCWLGLKRMRPDNPVIHAVK